MENVKGKWLRIENGWIDINLIKKVLIIGHSDQTQHEVAAFTDVNESLNYFRVYRGFPQLCKKIMNEIISKTNSNLLDVPEEFIIEGVETDD